VRLGAWPLGLVLFVCVHVGGEGGCRRRRHFAPVFGVFLGFGGFSGVVWRRRMVAVSAAECSLLGSGGVTGGSWRRVSVTLRVPGVGGSCASLGS